jgi:hypothetical protein
MRPRKQVKYNQEQIACSWARRNGVGSSDVINHTAAVGHVESMNALLHCSAHRDTSIIAISVSARNHAVLQWACTSLPAENAKPCRILVEMCK